MNKIVHSRKPTFTGMLTSGDLKSGYSIFCSFRQNVSPKIMTWEWIRTLYKVLHRVHSIKICFFIVMAIKNNLFKPVSRLSIWASKI